MPKMTVRELLNELIRIESQGDNAGDLPVMLRTVNDPGDQIMADDLTISVSAGCGDVEYCIIDGEEGGSDAR